MAEKYIRENRNSFVIVKGSRTFAKAASREDAIFLRDLLVENDWNLDEIEDVHIITNQYVVVRPVDEKLQILARSDERPDPDEIERLTKNFIRNPNNSKYGLNIAKVFDTYVIKKRIAGDDYVFGYYDRLDDAQFVRNFLLDNSWNVGAFSQIEYDEDTKNYRVIEVIDDRVYVLGTFSENDEIDLDRCRSEFLTKISKHKFGLAQYPHLEELTGEISHLEKSWQVSVRDDNWSFENAENPLDIIFSLTPFQKAVYDAVDSSTFEEIKKSLARYKSKNFDAKIQKNLEELVEMGLIVRRQDCFEKTNF